MKNIFLILALISCPAFSCKKEPAAHRFKAMTRDYFVFFGKNSWWEYAIEGYSDIQQWYALSSISGITDGSAMGSSGRYELFTASLGTLPDIGYSLCSYKATAGVGIDHISTGDYFSYTIQATDTSIGGDGSLPLEDGVVVNGHSYDQVLHLVNNDSYYKEVWIAPHTGIIRMIREDGRVLYLTKFKIENL